jgi:uncharacterized protein YndB with AHSA1/START domain
MSATTAEVSKTIDNATPASVWAALTDPAKLKQFFFGADVKSTWRLGSPITMKGEFNGKPYEDKGEIMDSEPGKLLSFSHWSALSGAADAPENYHLVTIELSPDQTGTKVTIRQSNLIGGAKPADTQQRSEYEKNWSMVLDGLARVVTGRSSAATQASKAR